jgi:luciferase family oxidoreductase group 1
MPSVAATSPPVVIAHLAAHTTRLRLGSGGVMLPNHAPLVVAEQFALLEAAHPGRIDLGIGRAPGTDPVTAWALRHGGGGVDDDAVARFPEYVDNITSMLSPSGVGLRLATGTHVLRATPHATSTPGRVAAGVVRLLGAAGGSEGAAVRLRAPLLGPRDG